MTGNTSMMLGGFAFEGLGFGYQGVSRRVQTPWVDISVAQVLNPQQWTGPTSDEITIKGVLFPEEFGGQLQLNGIISMAKMGLPLMLVSGDAAAGFIHGLHTVQSVDEDRSFHNARGQAGKNVYTISLKRYGDDAATAGARAIGGAVASLVNLLG